MVNLTTFGASLGLLALATQTVALPQPLSAPVRFPDDGATSPINFDKEVIARQDPSVAARNVRVMPFGASIVEITCWRALLWKKLQDANVKNFDFVGGNNGPAKDCTVPGSDKDHQGRSGAKATEYVQKNELPGFLSAAKPDVVVMHLGTNDVLASISADDIIKAYDTLLKQMRDSNAKITLVVTKILPFDPAKKEQKFVQGIVTLNTKIGEWAARNNNAQSPIITTDLFTGFNPATMSGDGTHPNDAGDRFIADRLFADVKRSIETSSVNLA